MPNVRTRVLGVLGGRDMDPELLRAWADSADVLIGADSGAGTLIDLGFQPVVVGDLDSIGDRDLPGLRVVEVADQDRTDCDKLLDMACEDGFDEVTLACIEGDLLDHVLGSLSSAVRASIRVRLALRNGIGWIVKPGGAQPSRLPRAGACRWFRWPRVRVYV